MGDNRYDFKILVININLFKFFKMSIIGTRLEYYIFFILNLKKHILLSHYKDYNYS